VCSSRVVTLLPLPSLVVWLTIDTAELPRNKVFIQASGLACEVYVEVSLLHSLPTTVCEVADSVVCQVAMLSSFNSL